MLIGQVSFNYPLGFLLLCAAFAVGVTAISYFKSKVFDDLAPWKKQLLIVIRFLALFTIAVLLMQPIVKQNTSLVEKPLLPLVIDNSESMIGSKEGEEASGQIQEYIKTLEAQLGEAYEVLPVDLDWNSLGDSLSFSGQRTDFGAVVKELKQRYRHAHLGGLVLVSDGIPTQGIAPEYLAGTFDTPVFSIGVGDTLPRIDAKIVEVVANKISFLDNLFPVEVFVKGEQLSGKSGTIKLEHKGKDIATQNIEFTTENQSERFSFMLEAKELGLTKYKVKIQVFDGENNIRNNQQEFFVEVKDRRKKIVIVANNPHPDIAALRRAIDNFEEYELEVFTSADVNQSIDDAHLLILHQIPARGERGISNRISSFPNNILYILGPEMDLREWQRYQKLVATKTSPAFESLLPVANEGFSLFQVSQDFTEIFSEMPPLRGFMNTFEYKGTGEAVFFSKIGRVETDRPMVFLGASEKIRYGVINGTGIWRWRMYNYKNQKDHKAFDTWIGQMLQYLTTQEIEERLQVNVPLNVNENDPLLLSGRLFDANFQLTNAAELNIVIASSNGKEYKYSFNRVGERYGLRLKGLESDQYTYSASVTLGGETFTQKGQFIVEKVAVEFLDLQARFNWMRDLSNSSGGVFYQFDNRNQLIDDLLGNYKTASLLKSTTKTEPLLSWWVLLLIIVTLLGIEWFFRKWFGAY